MEANQFYDALLAKLEELKAGLPPASALTAEEQAALERQEFNARLAAAKAQEAEATLRLALVERQAASLK